MLDRFTWFKQSGYLWRGDPLSVYIDPWSVSGDVPADVVFITHAHFDHYSPEDIERIRKDGTKIVAPRDVARELTGDVTPVAPGDALEVAGIKVQAVPAYNAVERRRSFHPKANNWVGYVLTLGPHTYYHAGDTDHLPELEAVRSDVAFLPIGGYFTMSPREAGALARAVSPRIAVPMHYGFVDKEGVATDAQTFRKEAEPVKVEILTPVTPFEST